MSAEEASASGLRPDDLGAAIAGHELDLYYQPIVSLADRSATMLEGLPRWAHPERGILTPGEFIGLAAENDLLVPLERWAIGAAVRQLEQWRTGAASELKISLNLSGGHLFEDDLAEALHGSGRGPDPGQRIGFEITERALIEGGARVAERLQALADFGASLIVDDYRGDAPESLLRALPTSALKISRSVIAEIPARREGTDAAERAIALGRDLGLASIAMGVESPGQLSSLRDLGCPYAQGFFFSVPVPVEVLEERLAGR